MDISQIYDTCKTNQLYDNYSKPILTFTGKYYFDVETLILLEFQKRFFETKIAQR